jgi:PncC family amidohydrolase
VGNAVRGATTRTPEQGANTARSEREPGIPELAAAFPDAASLGAMLVAGGLTIAVAESCTGGLLGAALTAVAGSSAYVRGGVIAYADDIKADHLGVGRHLLATHGAVSAEVAEAMAAGVRRRYQATIGVGITGVAGPDESEHKPAGLVFVAVVSPAGTRVARLEGDQGRESNRAHAVRAALALCIEVARGLVEAAALGPPGR